MPTAEAAYDEVTSNGSFGVMADDAPDHLKEADQLAKVYPRKTESSEGRVYLSVPYDDKEEVKPLGGHWDKDARSWWVSQEDWDANQEQLRQWKPEKVDVRKFGEPKASVAEVKAMAWTTNYLPAGYYALLNEDKWKFYRVTWGKDGSRWEGRAFLEIQASDDLHKISNPHTRNSIFERIAKDPKEAALQYGHQIGRCSVCNRTLTDEVSIANGIGPKCASKRGW